jgi:hypothetical protein
MTISSTTRVAGPYTGNGTASAFPFAFKVFAASDLDVVRLNAATGVETALVLNSDYTVTLNGNQNTNPGGTVTLVAGALATGFTLTLTSDLANLQPTDLTNQGGFYPDVINDSLDRATIQIQQLTDDIDRSIKAPISDTGLNMVLPPAAARANQYLAFDSNGEVDIGGAVPDQVYYGAKASDPATRNDGGPIQAGDLYFNSVASELRLYNGSVWASPANVFVTGVAPAGLTVTGTTTLNGGLVVRPSASAPSSNVTIGPGAGSTITGSNGSVAIGNNALAAQVDGAVNISNTVAGTLSTVGTQTGVQLVKASGAGTMAVYPIVTLTVGAGGDVTAIAITNPGSGSTVSSGIVFSTNDARIDPAWRGTLASVTVNTAVGRDALLNNTTGTGNSAVGVGALRSNTTGIQNSAVGVSALLGNTTGSSNSAVGFNALLGNTTGSSNSAVGFNALRSNTTGTGNSAVGQSAGRFRGASPSTDTVTVANDSVFIGYQSRAAGDSQTNQVVIAGADGVGNGSNTTTIGNSATTNTIIPAGNLTVSSGNLTVSGTTTFTGAPSHAADPASANVLSRKSYVDSVTRIGATNIIRMSAATTISYQTGGIAFTIASSRFRAPAGQTWEGTRMDGTVEAVRTVTDSADDGPAMATGAVYVFVRIS